MLTKQEKVDFVTVAAKDIKKYKVIGIVPLKSVPDKLVQSSRNGLKPDTKMILGRKSLLQRILESNEQTKQLSKYIEGTTAIVLSNDDPFELYQRFKTNSLKLSAKPNQLAPAEIVIQSGETALQPGMAVTELKQAGIDVQIQKGKVVIGKEKVIKSGEVITPGLAKALQTLGIKPFEVSIDPLLFLSEGMIFTRVTLGINKESMTADIMKAFAEALHISLETNMVNEYTIKDMVVKAYTSAVYVGVERNIYDKGIIEKLVGKAALIAAALQAKTESKEVKTDA